MAWREIDGFDAQSVIDSLPFYVLLIDEDHTIWMANQAVRRSLQINPEEAIGHHCPGLIHGCSGPFEGCPLEEAISTDRDVEKEITNPKTGERHLSCIYDTGYRTPEGKRLFLHTTKPIPCEQPKG